MKFYEFGSPEAPSVLCLPGNFMTHRQFEHIVPLLEQDYHVITVSFDGYDETGETTYTTSQHQAQMLAEYICSHLNGKVDLVYAESMGGVPAAYLTRIKDVQLGGVILSGLQDLDWGMFNGIIVKSTAWITHKLMGRILRKGRVSLPSFLLKQIGRDEESLQFMLGQMCQQFSRETVEATYRAGAGFYREQLSKWEPNDCLRIACWHGEKEANMQRAVAALRRAFPKLQVHVFEGMGHGENVDHPEMNVAMLKAFLNG